MSKKVSLGVAATVTLIAMAVTFSMTMTVSMNMFNNTVSSVKNKERMYNKLSEVDRYVRANEYFDINDDTLNDTIASGYMLGISDRYARYYSAKAYSERVGLANGRLMGIGVAVVNFPADVEKLLRSAIANWETKNNRKAENGELYVSKVFVDEGVTMKRMRPAPQGRGYRIRKRSNHVTLFVDAKTNDDK